MIDKMGNLSTVGRITAKKVVRNITMISLRRRRANGNMESSQNSKAVEIQAEEAVEMPESNAAMAEREGRLAICRSGDNGKSSVEVGGGYRWDRPPEDDCCPICHDDFHIPCRTNCGHWFCANCILHVWRYMAEFKQCVCPMCGCLIFNLISHPSALVQSGEDAAKILSDISRYNRQHMVGWFGILKKAVAPRFTLRMLSLIVDIMRLMLALIRLDLAYNRNHGYSLFPYGARGILMFFCTCTFALLTYVVWKRWRSLRRTRLMAEGNVMH